MNTATDNHEAGAGEDVKALAAGVLSQAVQDIRRFGAEGEAVERELHPAKSSASRFFPVIE
jgi:hypothetical protein